ncbi:MAG: 30S ribosome-binding factor RbfA [Eubacterium sp.]|nr:30S ribosome-binding factor RbfA [Eubacterium sp.]
MRGHKSSERSSRVNSDVQRVIGHIIEFELKDPRISGLTSVVKTEVTKDLKICKCYISVLGDDGAAESTIDGLRAAAGFVRKRLAESLNLRNTPEVNFVLDKSIEYGVNMSRKIDEILGNTVDNTETDE